MQCAAHEGPDAASGSARRYHDDELCEGSTQQGRSTDQLEELYSISISEKEREYFALHILVRKCRTAGL